MKKNIIRITALFLCALTVFLSTPFNSLKIVKAANSWDNFIDFIRTNIGLVSVSNGSLSGTDRGSFYASLYSTSLVWRVNDNHFTFIPSSIFSKSEWIACCNSGGSDIDSRFNDFNIQECLILSDYVTDTGSGYHLQNFPSLSDFSDSVSPLEGVHIQYDFSNFDNFSSHAFNASRYQSNFDYVKSIFLEDSSVSSLYIFSHEILNNGVYSVTNNFVAPVSGIEFTFFVPDGNKYWFYLKQNGVDSWMRGRTSSYLSSATSGGYNDSFISQTNYGLYGVSFDTQTGLSFSRQTNGTYIYTDGSVWTNEDKIIFADTEEHGKSLYNWLYASPSGNYYTSNNITNNNYSYDYVNNNTWDEIYNNFVTDVSNYYSTTENITNQQLSEYIDRSTTITNITNNYITNSGGGSGEDDIITNSWLERIYNKLVEIKSILISGHDPDSGDTYYTDNSIKNEIIEYPTSDLFPDVPTNNFISTAEDFTIDLFATKMSAIISEVIPFCYLEILKSTSIALAAPPSAPYWEIPFKIDRLNIDETVILDMTGEEWDSVHNVWITLFMIIFVSFLFYLTYRVVLLVSNLFA